MKLVRRGETRERVVAIFKRDLTLMLLHALLMYYFTLMWISQCISVKSRSRLIKHSRPSFTGGGLHLKDDIRMH